MHKIATKYVYVVFMLSAFLSFTYGFSDIIRVLLLVGCFIIGLSYVKVNSIVDYLIIVYCLCGVLSIFGWIEHHYPIEFYLQIMVRSYFPIVFYFIGKSVVDRFPDFYKYSLFACVFCFVIGFVWLVTEPSWYVEKSLALRNVLGYYTEESLYLSRFSSFLDSYYTGNLGVFALCCSMGYLEFCTKEWKTSLLYWIFLIIAIVAIMLSRQRVCMFCGLGILVAFNIKMFRKKPIQPFLFIIFVIITLVFISTIDTHDNLFIEQITERFSDNSTSTMVSMRENQWLDAINNQRNFIFGHGAGGGGHLAYFAGIKPVVCDGSYSKILLETGVLSFIVFITMLILTVMRSVMREGISFELMMLLFYICSFIGSNIIDMHYIIISFWFVLGRLNRNNNINRNIITTIYE